MKKMNTYAPEFPARTLIVTPLISSFFALKQKLTTHKTVIPAHKWTDSIKFLLQKNNYQPN